MTGSASSAFAFHRPRSLDEALALMQAISGASFIAGGTDLAVDEASAKVPALVSLRSIPELAGIDGRRIGAATPIADLISDAGLRDRYPVLVQAARRLGSRQIRNVATIGGNLCRAAPCADLAPPLLVLGARLQLQRGERLREVSFEEFMVAPGRTCLEPGELLVAIVLDEPRPSASAIFLKKGRARMDLSLASVAVLLVMDGDRCETARVAAGSVAPTPIRLPEVEALLEGETITRKLLARAKRAAAAGVAPISDVRTTAAYRRRIVGAYVQRGVETLLGWGDA